MRYLGVKLLGRGGLVRREGRARWAARGLVRPVFARLTHLSICLSVVEHHSFYFLLVIYPLDLLSLSFAFPIIFFFHHHSSFWVGLCSTVYLFLLFLLVLCCMLRVKKSDPWLDTQTDGHIHIPSTSKMKNYSCLSPTFLKQYDGHRYKSRHKKSPPDEPLEPIHPPGDLSEETWRGEC